ncbi:MAG: Rrf2 family transcriptional regulator [Peptococcaceae bacterium]|jgi:Rrf2 family protein|nr:Rrf2 family transcriptional regulator [Peptococcaceae bacterium]
MRISAKGRYALAAMIEIARSTRENEIISVINIVNALGISKIYLEQILSQLKKGNIIYALKGSKGGYRLVRDPRGVTALDILLTVENTLIEKADSTVDGQSPAIEMALREMVFNRLDSAVETCLKSVSIQDLLDYTDQQRAEQSYMLNL